MRRAYETPRCSFCEKEQHEVRKLIAGPNVYICDECIELCNDIIAEEWEREQDREHSRLPDPTEIERSLDRYILGQARAKSVLAATAHAHNLELPRFRGQPIVGAERSVHDAEEPSAVPARFPAANR